MKPSTPAHWLRQCNPVEASKVMIQLARLPSTNSADERAAVLFGLARQRGFALTGASLGHLAQLIALPDQLNAAAPDMAALRELARAHAASPMTRRPPPTTLLQITRPSAMPPEPRPQRPGPGEPITQIAAYIEPGSGGGVLNLEGADLRNVPDLAAQINKLQSKRNPALINFRGANLSGVDLQGVNLSRADLREARLVGANLSHANLHVANLRDADLGQANLTDARVTAHLERANLKGANLTDANLDSAGLAGADLSGATLVQANLSHADLNRANLGGANLTAAYMPNAQLASAVLEGATLNQASLYRADLEGAHLAGANLVGANLTQAKLQNANLSASDLSRARLNNADLSGANLTRANVNRANLRGALLIGSRQLGVDWSQAIDVSNPARGTQQAPLIRPGATAPRATTGTPTANSLADPAAQREAVRALMARYDVPAEVRTEKMEALVLAEIDRTRQAELQLFQHEGQPPADVVEGRSTEVEFLGRTASLGNYLRYLRLNPERLQPIANRTLYAEAQYLELASEANNAGVLREPQWRAIERESDPSRRAYLTHRAMSSALQVLDAEWSARLSGRAMDRAAISYDDATVVLSDISVAPDDRYTDRPSDEANETLAQRMRPEWGQALPLGVSAESQRRTIFTKARVLDQVGSIELRLSIMGQMPGTDRSFVQNGLSRVNSLISEMQGMASDERRSTFATLSPYEAQQVLANVLAPLKTRLEGLLR
jgi:uncharacterized protein YjbI with pentapeptide repeats